MTLLESIYTSALRVATLAEPALAIGESKLARGIRGRRGSLERIGTWARGARDLSRPLVWFHAPSVGEGLQARAVIEALRDSRPDVQIAYTYFSPSAVAFAERAPVDISDYLPIDLPGPVSETFDLIRPDAIVFTKTEVWPNITREAQRRNIPSLLLSATLPETSSRLRGPARLLLSPSHRRLRHVAAISEADGRRFESLGVSPDRISVMGDARFDQVWQRVRRPMSDPALMAVLEEKDGLTVVAGSTWPEDEERLLSAFAAAKESTSNRVVRLIVAPHEPSAEHLSGLRDRLRTTRLDSALLSDLVGMTAVPRVVVIDRVGILGDLYRLAAIAYVGGGFGRDGLHSVLEPAAFGVPVLFGPHYSNSREAAELLDEGAARSVHDENDLNTALARWMDNTEARQSAGRRALHYVESGLGAAETGAGVIRSVIRTR